MKKSIIVLTFLSLFVISCKKYSVEENKNIEAIVKLPTVPYDYSMVSSPSGYIDVKYINGSNNVNNNYATLGRVLFYDKNLSINNTVSCASCHIQEFGFSDVVDKSIGFNKEKTTRNSMPINNLNQHEIIGFFWDLRESNIENMVAGPITNHIEMGFTKISQVVDKIAEIKYYKSLFEKYTEDGKITVQNLEKALGSFTYSIVNVNSKFDQGKTNDFANFSASEKEGKRIYDKNDCATCHNLIAPTQYYGSVSGKGNTGIEEVNTDNGKDGGFKIPFLNNIELTAPYMHDGRFKTLREVLDHYSDGIKPNQYLSSLLKDQYGHPKKYNFTETDKDNLIAFLKTLTDRTNSTNPKFSNPFVKQ